MHICKKILVVSLLISSPLFAFDFSYKLDRMADNLSNTLFDKAADGVNNTIEQKPQKRANPSRSRNKMEQMKELVEMKKQGYITDREFRQQKKIILSQK